MQITVTDTRTQYRQLLSLPQDARKGFYTNTILQTFQPMFDLLHMPADPGALSCLSPDAARDGEASGMLERLEAADAWGQVEEALARGAERFASAGVPLPERVTAGLFLGDPAALVPSCGWPNAPKPNPFLRGALHPSALLQKLAFHQGVRRFCAAHLGTLPRAKIEDLKSPCGDGFQDADLQRMLRIVRWPNQFGLFIFDEHPEPWWFARGGNAESRPARAFEAGSV